MIGSGFLKSIMFVCTGNICRSPMAHGYMQKRVYDLKKENEYMISSCGTNAIGGESATYNAIKAMQNYKVDISKHRATNIEDSNIENYDLIITLTENHKRIILDKYPSLINKTFTLKEYVNNKDKYKNIDDPWGLDINVYNSTAKEIVENVDKILEII